MKILIPVTYEIAPEIQLQSHYQPWTDALIFNLMS